MLLAHRTVSAEILNCFATSGTVSPAFAIYVWIVRPSLFACTICGFEVTESSTCDSWLFAAKDTEVFAIFGAIGRFACSVKLAATSLATISSTDGAVDVSGLGAAAKLLTVADCFGFALVASGFSYPSAITPTKRRKAELYRATWAVEIFDRFLEFLCLTESFGNASPSAERCIELWVRMFVLLPHSDLHRGGVYRTTVLLLLFIEVKKD